MNKKILALLLLFYSVFGNGLLDKIDNIVIPVIVKPEVKILDIKTPTEEIRDRVAIFSELITNKEDREKIAVFNYEFSQRIVGYETTSQQVNDVYSLAGKIVFDKTLVGKYEGLAENIVKLMEEILTDENHSVNQEEKEMLSQYFAGIAWTLLREN